jgi:gas vesicle protein
MSKNGEDSNSILYLLAGVGLGAIIGAAAGLLLAPKAGVETREELAEKLKELKSKTEEWIAEQKAKKAQASEPEELGV